MELLASAKKNKVRNKNKKQLEFFPFSWYDFQCSDQCRKVSSHVHSRTYWVRRFIITLHMNAQTSSEMANDLVSSTSGSNVETVDNNINDSTTKDAKSIDTADEPKTESSDPAKVSPQKSNPYANVVPDRFISASERRSERLRNQSARQAEARKIKLVRAEAEAAAAKARSAAARKGAETRRRAGLALEESRKMKVESGKPKSRKRMMVKLQYANPEPAPEFHLVNLDVSTEIFWLRTALREFFLRFDKLCRIPARYASQLNALDAEWTSDMYKTSILSMLKLLQNDYQPPNPALVQCLASIESLPVDEGSNDNDSDIENVSENEEYKPKTIWDCVRIFIRSFPSYQLSPPIPDPVDGTDLTEKQKLLLLRELQYLCLATETIRVTIQADSEQLRALEKSSQEEVKKIQLRLKEQNQKLLKLKKVDKAVYQDRIESAQKSAQNRTFKAQQQVYQKVHKFNMRTLPIAEDTAGNKFWSLQYKSAAFSDWGAWILCDMKTDPVSKRQWERTFAQEIDRVTQGRDKMFNEKKEAKKNSRKLKSEQQDSNANEVSGPPASGVDTAESNSNDIPQPVKPEPSAEIEVATTETNAVKKELNTSNNNTTTSNNTSSETQPRRKYPKMNVPPMPKPIGPRLFTVRGKQDIEMLAQWMSQQPGVDDKMPQDIIDVGKFLSEE